MGLSKTRYNCEEIIVKYKVIKGETNDKLDRIFEKIANECGLEFVGSGYNFKTKRRDLQFRSKLYGK